MLLNMRTRILRAWIHSIQDNLPISHEAEVQDPQLQLPSYLESTPQSPIIQYHNYDTWLLCNPTN